MNLLRLGLLLLLTVPLAAEEGARRITPEEAFKEASTHFRASNFTEAAALYKKTAALVSDSPSAHYNLGNTLLRIQTPGSLGHAIASYARAFRLAPRDADIRHNLDFALKLAGEELVPAGTPPILWLAFHSLSRTELTALHHLFLWSALLLGTLWVVRPEWRERVWTPLAVFCGLWMATAGWWGARTAIAMNDPAIVVRMNAEVRSGPGGTFSVGFKVPEGRRVSRIGGRKGKWVEIGVPKEGLKGWIDADALEPI